MLSAILKSQDVHHTGSGNIKCQDLQTYNKCVIGGLFMSKGGEGAVGGQEGGCVESRGLI